MTILVVDDDPFVRRTVPKLFDAETRTAASLNEGLFEARSWQPSVVLLDVHFRGLARTGIDAVPEFRAAVPRAKIIILTGLYEEHSERRAISAGAWAYLEKGNQRLLLATVLAARRRVSVGLYPSVLPQ